MVVPGSVTSWLHPLCKTASLVASPARMVVHVKYNSACYISRHGIALKVGIKIPGHYAEASEHVSNRMTTSRAGRWPRHADSVAIQR